MPTCPTPSINCLHQDVGGDLVNRTEESCITQALTKKPSYFINFSYKPLHKQKLKSISVPRILEVTSETGPEPEMHRWEQVNAQVILDLGPVALRV